MGDLFRKSWPRPRKERGGNMALLKKINRKTCLRLAAQKGEGRGSTWLLANRGGGGGRKALPEEARWGN